MPGSQEADRRTGAVGPRTGAVGPVQTPGEAGHPDYLGPPPTAVVEARGLSLERRLRAWWDRLGKRRRRLGLLAAAGLALGLLWGATLLPHPSGSTPVPPLVPFPGQAVEVHYAGLDATGGPARFTVRLAVTDTSDATMTLLQVAQPYRGVDVTTAQLLPLRLFPGRPQPVWVQMTVRDCSLTPRADVLPFIDVTLSNARAIQTQSEILGTAYARDLRAAILKACPPAAAPSGNSAARSAPAVP
ncbi:hypothetical protein [Streptacidiphilus cavernicola]|uniref:Tat pathway signal sequence domain protein n=1 Tax=Streptacidiphilus cavernicola TaxID=3342716 RepID=A0ABV6VT80_9ACTN